jgi:NAD(P)-dependent dehydrogenase (short-subunit alcohol dehydrogenase family)
MPAFNNAGFNGGGAPLLDTGDDECDRFINIILRGVCNCIKGGTSADDAQGAIVNGSSMAEWRDRRDEVPTRQTKDDNPQSLRNVKGSITRSDPPRTAIPSSLCHRDIISVSHPTIVRIQAIKAVRVEMSSFHRRTGRAWWMGFRDFVIAVQGFPYQP